MFNFNNLSPLNYIILFHYFLIDQLRVVYVYGM